MRNAGYRLLVAIFMLSLATLQFGMLCWGVAHPEDHWLMRHILLGTVTVIAAIGAGTWEIWRTHRYAAALRQLGVTESPALPGVRIIEVPASLAFCIGIIQPRIYISRGLINRLSVKELQAVLDHETYHQKRRDPLRLVLMDMVAVPLFFLPAVQEWRKILRARLELKADAYAVKQTGRAALAGALHSLLSEETIPLPTAAAGLSVNTIRVASLLGERQPMRVSVRNLLISIAILWSLCFLLVA